VSYAYALSEFRRPGSGLEEPTPSRVLYAKYRVHITNIQIATINRHEKLGDHMQITGSRILVAILSRAILKLFTFHLVGQAV
jgi:hypothetical protein